MTQQRYFLFGTDRETFIHLSVQLSLSQIGSNDLDLAPPLATGIWTLLVVDNGSKIAETKFLVVPLDDDLSVFPGKIHAQQEKWESFLDLQDQSKGFLQAAPSSRTINPSSQLDSYTSIFYMIQESCLVRMPSTMSCTSNFTLMSCSKIMWSSLSPDSKSYFG